MRTITRAKTCCTCGHRKPLNEFWRESRSQDGRRGRCKSCGTRSDSLWLRDMHNRVFNHYGRVCVCCGSTKDLTLDHVHGNGPEHLKRLGIQAGCKFYAWLIRNNFPAECEPGQAYALQTMCLSCNSSKGRGDHCRMHCIILDHDHYCPKYQQHKRPKPQPQDLPEEDWQPVPIDFSAATAPTA